MNTAFIYDGADQPRAVTGGVYIYDGNLKRAKAFVNGQTVYNVYDSSGTLVHVETLDAASGSKAVNYVNGPMGTLARIEEDGSADGKVTYMHGDHLGSTTTATNASGGIEFRESYTPFGETINNAAANDNQAGFTGHIKDKATGLNYMQARYYDPNIGRFLSVDPVTFGMTNDPGYFNRYAYTQNNPINFIDPNGMCTGSRLTNGDGTCASTGGSTTGITGLAQGMQIDQAKQDYVQYASSNSSNKGNSSTSGSFGSANNQVSQVLCGVGTCGVDISSQSFLAKAITGRHGQSGRDALSNPLGPKITKGVFNESFTTKEDIQKLAIIVLQHGVASHSTSLSKPGRVNIDLRLPPGKSVGRDFSFAADGMIPANGVRLQVDPTGIFRRNFKANGIFPKHFYK